MADVLLLEREAIRGTFRDWQAEQESLDAQLTESLSALAAYQSHLDAWQQQLARQRDQLRQAQEQFERDQATAENSRANLEQSSAEIAAEMSAAREKISALTSSLLARTQELQSLDQCRTEIATELELTRARETELKSALDEQKQTFEHERAQWAEELRQVRGLLEDQTKAAPLTQHHNESSSRTADQRRATSCNHPADLSENPVLGSIVQQFGKLRQQRASDREALRKAR